MALMRSSLKVGSLVWVEPYSDLGEFKERISYDVITKMNNFDNYYFVDLGPRADYIMVLSISTPTYYFLPESLCKCQN